MMRRNLRSERGAVMAEAALVTPFVLMMIMSVVWGALLFRTYLTANHSVANGARRASIAAGGFDADWQVLNEVKPSLTATSGKAVNRIIIYPATGYGDGPSADCLASSAGCNTYDSTALDRARPVASGDWVGDTNYAPANRASGNGLVGVYIEIRPGAEGLLLPAPKVVKAHKVFKLEGI